MRRRLRRIVGMIALTVFVTVYIAVAMVIGAVWFVDVHPLIQLGYFAFAGIAWTVPAAGIILWMRGGG